MSVPMCRAAHAALAVLALATSCVLAGCANGDFDRVRPNLVADDIHDWVGRAAARGNGAPVSDDPLTDDERLMRDLAYPLIEPPYDRQRWYAILKEYGIDLIFQRDWSRFDEEAYVRALMREPARSQAARYARLSDDVRNDRTRIPQFFMVARRVLEMDDQRARTLAAISHLTEPEAFMAVARNAENALVISWVQWSLVARAVSYHYALERLAIMSPMPAAIEIERSLVALQDLINAYRLLPGPDIAPGPEIFAPPPFAGPVLPPPPLPPPPRQPVSVLGRTAAPAPPG
jgi:hypothetical protein